MAHHKKQEIILSSKEDQKTFFDALTNPPKPNNALKMALADYKKSFRKLIQL